jgi:EAL domain-containing protein (putative c-di-GMP-specific phosphodiesterase class I)/GGDEF domain-containing protein
LLPIVRHCTTYTQVEGSVVVLYYMQLAFLLALVLFYGLAALPGIIVALVLHYYPSVGGYETTIATAHFLIPLILSWGGYRVFSPRRNMVAYGDVRLMASRLFWQMFCPATIFFLLFQFAVYLGVYESRFHLAGLSASGIRSLINYQGLLVGCLTGVPFCYVCLRVIRHPRYLRSLFSQVRAQLDPKVTMLEIVLWLAINTVLLGMLLWPLTENSSIFSTNYTLSLIMPVMLWGSMRFGYKLMSLLWTPILIVSIHYFYRYIPWSEGYDIQLTITSSSYLVFTFVVVYMAMLATRQRSITLHARRLAFLDPVLHMPNLRALSRALSNKPWSALCFLRIPELEVLGRNYGVLLRIQYKQKLAEWLSDYLEPDESAYQLSGHDLAMRLNTESYQTRIEEIDQHIKRFRFYWDGMPLQPQVGVSYCYVRSPVVHLYLLLGELSTIADLSLSTCHPENLQQRGAINMQRGLKDKVEMMNRVQRALENDTFTLMAQPVQGIRGDNYHEVLLRMNDEKGEMISPDLFLPVAQEFGLSSRIDLWVLEKTLRFMADNRADMPGKRFAINLSPSSICRAHLPLEVGLLLQKYAIESWQLVFEITESSSFGNAGMANQVVSQLQKMGCRIAIDDFGTGYASYARLKNVDADILKIDGSFIRNMVSNSLDYQIVASICHLARMKNMLVVAEYVENEAIRDAAMALGIDYLQGYFIGKPEPMDNLLVAQALDQSA